MRYVEVTKALYDYEARTDEELSIKEDDILYVIEKEDEDWWKAELKQPHAEQQGPIGLVPASYLEEIAPIGKVRAEFDYEAQQEEELTFHEGDEMLLLETDDPDWYLVKLKDGQIGLAPSNYVQMGDEQFEDAQEEYQQTPIPALPPPPQPSIPTPPPAQSPVQAFIPPPPVQPILSQPTGSATSLPREIINDDAQSWNVHEYDAAKKKKKKSKGSLFVGNGMLCYGSETDKSLPVQQYPILDVTKYLYDGKNLHIEVEGAKQAILDFQASSKSEAKAILAKISDSARAAQMSNTHVNQNSPDRQIAAPAAAIPPRTGSSRIEHQPEPEPEEEEEESNCVPKWGISLYAFQAEGSDEITVDENEQIYVLDYERTDGWWRVQKVDGETGLVPSSYVQFDDEEEENENTAQSAENFRQQREEEEHALQQQRMAEEEAREQQRKREQEERERKKREEDERRCREEEIQRREEETRRREEEIRRKEEETRRREEENRRREEEYRRKEEQRRREEEVKERERQKQAAEAAKRAEAARQKQIEEDYKKKEAERKAQLARSSSQSKKYKDLPKPDPTKIRTWTDRSGSFKVEAQFIDFHNGKLRLHKLNGVKIDVPVEKMCADDIRWVENHTKRQEEPEITPAMPPRPQQSAPPPPPSQVPAQSSQKTFNERWDWFDWFMIIGIPMQASLQYASAFKADKLDDSDIQKLTHKQMKSLGVKEEHVRRIERYIETGQPEDLNEEEEEKKKKEQDQISKDEELARKLQKEWEANEASQNKSPSNGRPRPSVSAPKDVHPDLLDFIGTQLSSDTGKNKGKEPEKPKGGDLLGFNDDAWAPRADNSPIAALAPTKITPAAVTPPPPPPQAQPTGPTPEQLKAQEAERRRIQEEEQIQKIQLLSLQKQTNEQKKQLEELQKLTQQQIELQKQIAMQTGSQQQQHMLQMQAQQAQLQQAQLQQQLAPQFPQLQTSYTNQFANSQPTGFISQATGFNNSQPTGFTNNQSTGFNNSQPTGFNNSQSTGFLNQATGFQNQATGFGSPLNNGRPRPTANNNLIQDPTLGQWQPNQQQTQPTGFQPNALVTQQQNAWQGLQPQMTGFPPSNNALPPPLAPSTAGQQNVFNNNGLQRSQTIGVQPTGRHWNNSTPANPFGSPTLSPLQAQMTGVQFSTPSPQAFNSSPLQQQPQMTGFQQPSGNSVFTPQGSMQYGQSAFPAQRPW